MQQAAGGFKVWRDYDGPDGLEQYMDDLAAANADILDLVVIGDTGPQGDGRHSSDIVACGSPPTRTTADGDKPAVLYSSTIHAREWIATEVNRRLLEWFIKGWRRKSPRSSTS